jgi:hypothetical protein
LHLDASRRAPPHLPVRGGSVCLPDVFRSPEFSKEMHTPASQDAQGLDRIGYPRLAAVSAKPFEIGAKEVQARIGAAIRRRRRFVEVTLTQLAQACGVSFQQVQKYESGACSISAAQLWNMAQALGVPISYFYESASDDRRAASAA